VSRLFLRLVAGKPLEPIYEAPGTCFAQLLAWYGSVQRGEGDLRKEISPAMLEHPQYTVAHARMLTRLNYGVPTTIHNDESGTTYSTNNFGPGIGQWVPGQVILIVNDRMTENWHKCPTWSFISGVRGGTGAWLANQLEEYKVPERSLYWVNAYSPPAVAQTPGFVERLRPVSVYALGRNSGAWCRQHVSMPFREVHHPSHWRTKHSGDRYILPRLLAQDLGLRMPIEDMH
jgi:hypothetical protein